MRLLTVLVVLATTLVLSALAAGDHVRRRAHDPGCRSAACDHRIDAWLARLRRGWETRSRPVSEALASWYDDAGSTACGTHYLRGLASLTLACGTAVRLCHSGCETAYVQDRGPYVAGRLFDLNPGAKEAIGCDDLCAVRWYVR